MARKNFSLLDTLFKVGENVYKENKRQNNIKKNAQLKAQKASEKRVNDMREYKKMQSLSEQGYIFMSRRQLKKYSSIMEGELLNNYLAAPTDSAVIPIFPSSLEVMDRELAERKERERSLKQCAALNNKGIAYEKEGKINLAIKTYEKNILSDYPATHSYDRLMIIYRKEKMHDDEIRVIERAFVVFHANNYSNIVEKWKLRFEKAKALRKKA